jgi:hypothetical protein
MRIDRKRLRDVIKNALAGCSPATSDGLIVWDTFGYTFLNR